MDYKSQRAVHDPLLGGWAEAAGVRGLQFPAGSASTVGGPAQLLEYLWSGGLKRRAIGGEPGSRVSHRGDGSLVSGSLIQAEREGREPEVLHPAFSGTCNGSANLEQVGTTSASKYKGRGQRSYSKLHYRQCHSAPA